MRWWWAALLSLAMGRAEAGFFDAGTNAPGTNSTVITSDHLTYNYRQMAAEFDDNVVVIDPRMNLRADKLTVLFRKDNSIKSATAVGRVRIEQGERRATCHQAVYLAGARQVVMTGDGKTPATLTQGADTLTGDTITFWMDDDRVTSTGSALRIGPGTH
jgi:lipopolysaccharide export system protein LptA